eukprot:g48098.t1
MLPPLPPSIPSTLKIETGLNFKYICKRICSGGGGKAWVLSGIHHRLACCDLKIRLQVFTSLEVPWFLRSHGFCLYLRRLLGRGVSKKETPFPLRSFSGTAAPPWNLAAGYILPSGGQADDTTLALKISLAPLGSQPKFLIMIIYVTPLAERWSRDDIQTDSDSELILGEGRDRSGFGLVRCYTITQ